MARRRLAPIAREQMAIIAVIAVGVLLGIGWGLPSRERIELLQAGGPPTPDQIRLLNTLHTLRAAGQIPVDSLPSRRGFGPSLPRWYESTEPGPWLAFTEVERLYAFRSYILSTSIVDEDYTMVALGNMNPRRLDFDPKRYIYGGSYLYPVGLLLFVMESTGLLRVSRDFTEYIRDPSQIARIYAAGRLLNLAALVGTLILLALLVRRLHSVAAGTVAILAYGLSTLILEHTVVMKPHVFTAFWVTLAVYLLVRHVQGGSLRSLVLSILAAGYAAGSSAPAATVGLLYPIVLFDRARPGAAARASLAALVGMAAVFLVMNPWVVVNFEAYRSTVATVSADTGTGLGVFGLHKLPWYLHGAFVRSYTFPVMLLCLPCLVWCFLRGSGTLRRLALATVALLLIFGTTSPMVRISAFVAPMYGVFAGIAAVEWILVPLRTKPLLRAGLVALLFLPGAAYAGLVLRDLALDRVWYERTKAWVRSAGIGPGSTIGVLFTPNPSDLPAFPFLHARLIDLNAAAAAADPPEYVLIGNYRMLGRGLWETHPLRSRYQQLYDLGHRPSFDWLRRDPALDQARTGGFVFRRIGDPPADTRSP